MQNQSSASLKENSSSSVNRNHTNKHKHSFLNDFPVYVHFSGIHYHHFPQAIKSEPQLNSGATELLFFI